MTPQGSKQAPDRELEARLRAARPPVPPLPADFAAQVWAEVERQGIVPRPAWALRVKVWAVRVAAVALLAAGALTLDAAVYEVRNNGALEVLYFGARMLDGFLRGIPYDLVLATLLTGGAVAWLLRYARFARVPVAWALLIAYGLTGTGGLTLAATGINDAVRKSVLEEEAAPKDGQTAGRGSGGLPGVFAGMMMGYFTERAVYHRPHARFRMGKVLSRDGNLVRLESPAGEEMEARLPPGFQARPGDHLRLIVDPDGTTLRARAAQHCGATAERYFHHMRMMRGRGMGPGHMGPGMGPGRMGPGMGPGHMGPGMRGGMGGGMGMGPGRMGGMGMGPGMAQPAPEQPAPDAQR